jgi:hypothetical protein
MSEDTKIENSVEIVEEVVNVADPEVDLSVLDPVEKEMAEKQGVVEKKAETVVEKKEEPKVMIEIESNERGQFL